MDEETLKENYKKACDDYLNAFISKHEFDKNDSRWIADRPGEIADVFGYCVDMQTIVDDIDMDAPEDEFLKWYEYTVDMKLLGAETIPNFRSWVRNCPRHSPMKIEELKRHQKDIEKLKEELINSINSINSINEINF